MAPSRRYRLRNPVFFGFVVSLLLFLLLAPLGAALSWLLQLPSGVEMALAKGAASLAVFIGALASAWLAYPPRAAYGLALGLIFAALGGLVALVGGEAGIGTWLSVFLPPLAMGALGGLLGSRRRTKVKSPLTGLQGE